MKRKINKSIQLSISFDRLNENELIYSTSLETERQKIPVNKAKVIVFGDYLNTKRDGLRERFFALSNHLE